MARPSARTPTRRADRLAGALAAAVLGGLSWLAAHLLTGRLPTHSHPGPDGTTAVEHLHRSHAAAVVGLFLLASCLAAAAVVTLPLRRRGGDPAGTVRRASAASTATFLLVECVDVAVAGKHAVPAPMLLLYGAAIHALVGAAAGLVWQRNTDRVLRLAVHLLQAGTPEPETTAVPPADDTLPLATRWLTGCAAGRAPPAAPA
ncbi:hypothetical protein ACFPIJ_10660 [Dactylosporangium cerinum]|uniref:Uncharacterized protein n=1 Tax=Dactylosporangium cerinum TaxID=1434730 RepID=A0ABV9VQ85_9ACTN